MALQHLNFSNLTAIAARGGPLSHRAVFKRSEPSLRGFGAFLSLLYIAIGSACYTTSKQSRVQAAQDAASLIVIYLMSLSAAILHYRVLDPSHPLHNVPGPVCALINAAEAELILASQLLAKATQWWLFYQIVSGQSRSGILKAQRKYGTIIRIGPNEVLSTDPEETTQILGAKGWRKGHA